MSSVWCGVCDAEEEEEEMGRGVGFCRFSSWGLVAGSGFDDAVCDCGKCSVVVGDFGCFHEGVVVITVGLYLAGLRFSVSFSVSVDLGRFDRPLRIYLSRSCSR